MKLLRPVRDVVCRSPALVASAWLALALGLTLTAPDLSRLAAEGQARLVPEGSESARAGRYIRRLWPDQWAASTAAAALHRPGGLTEADRAFAARLAGVLRGPGAPENLLRVVGPDAPGPMAERLVSRDRTMQLVLAPLGTAFVAPASQDAVRWLRARAAALERPAGLELFWTGDAVIGRDYMHAVRDSLDRAAIATVGLLLVVLLVVYRSPLVAAVPLVTIGVGLLVSRAVLGWMARSGWEISPLVELFLVVILFGCGTDFCLFLSWRFGELWEPGDPAAAMTRTLKAAAEPILTSAATVIVGLSLMGTTRFKLFASTGPSVALGLALTLIACLTLTPALLVLLAWRRPRSFAWMTRPKGDVWSDVARFVLRRPLACWAGTLLVMTPLVWFGARARFLQDTMSEMPASNAAVVDFRRLAAAFGPGAVAPLNVVIHSETADLGGSEGLALIDDLSRLLSRQRRLAEVRSATQPLGDPRTLEPARLASRLEAVNEGFARMEQGADVLRRGLIDGAARLRTALQLRRWTGVDLTGSPAESSRSLVSGLSRASTAILGGKPAEPSAPSASDAPPGGEAAKDPRELLAGELGRAADGAGQIVEGARRARAEVAGILEDPVGRRALDRLLITPATVRDFPELKQSLAAYLSPDGHTARLDIAQADPLFSTEAMRQVGALRRRLADFLQEQDEVPIDGFGIAGANAESADVWSMTRRDQTQVWVVVPLGVFLILVVALRDPLSCLNLVATMILTYLFALGVTHLVFVEWLGAEGLDWKVPLFLFVLLVAVGVDYNIFLMSRLQTEARALGLRPGIHRAVALTGGLITSAAAITASSFASFLTSPLASIRQLGFALVVGITVDALLVRPVLVPCGHLLIHRGRQGLRRLRGPGPMHAPHVRVGD